MSILASIVLLFSGLFALTAFVGLFAPKLFTDKKTGNIPKRSQLFLGGIVMSVILLVVGLFMMPNDNAATAPTATAQTSTTKPTTENTNTPTDSPKAEFTFNFDEYRRNLNKEIKHLGGLKPIPASLKPSGSEKSVNHTANHHLKKGLVMVLSANPETQQMRGITLILAPSEITPSEILLAMVSSANVLAAADTSNDKELPGKLTKMIVRTAQKFADNPDDEASETLSLKGVKYSVMVSKYTGVMMFAEPE
ncbi:hypothetical protein [Neisseria wadsworthii]|uniref:hypothetical protein n=1 Tax=Neisseria wadsworthii TaxID=607711 RepID=UPI000D30904E|nr:hypothetical protein [Neisseria wadsworthii]